MKKWMIWVAIVLIVVIVVAVIVAVFGRDTFDFGTIFKGKDNNDENQDNSSGDDNNSGEEDNQGGGNQGGPSVGIPEDDQYPGWGSPIPVQ